MAGIAELAVVVFVAYALLLVLSPFPYWPSYRAVFSSVAAARSITPRQRAVLYKYLLKDLLVFPVISFFWLIDELFFRGYRKIEVKAPVFIVGQPRSGTTFLHRTLSADKSFISLKHLEWRYPLISVWKLIDLLHLRSWVEKLHYWPNTPAGRTARKMHEHRLGSFEEHGIFFEERFYHHYFVFRRYPFPELLGKVTNFSDLSERDRSRMIDVFKRVVQKTMYYRGRDRVWLTKENESIELYEMMARAFPDSRLIFIVRNPDEFVDSYINLSKTSTLTKTGIHPDTLAQWHDANIAFRRSECTKLVEFWSDASKSTPSVAVTYRQLTTDIVGTVTYIYEQIGLPMSEEYATHLRELATKQRVRQRGYENVHYDTQGFDFYSRFVADVEASRAPEIDIAIIDVPHIENATDFRYLNEQPHVQVRYVKSADSLGAPDAIILPGTTNATSDLDYLRRAGLESAVASHVGRIPILGVCGGFEMLGRMLHDPERVESALGTIPGMGLLDIEVEFSPEKKMTTNRIYAPSEANPFREAGQVEGFEAHSGTVRYGACRPAYTYAGGVDGAVDPDRWIFGTFIHGLFRNTALVRMFIDTLWRRRGLPHLITPLPSPLSARP